MERPAANEAPSGGLEWQRTEGELKPPLAGIEGDGEQERLSQLGEVPKLKAPWPPLKPVAVTPFLELKAAYLAERTEWDGWLYSPKQLEDIGELIEACGLTAPAWAQLLGAIAGLDAAKYIQFRLWRSSGQPEPKGKVAGAVPPPEGR